MLAVGLAGSRTIGTSGQFLIGSKRRRSYPGGSMPAVVLADLEFTIPAGVVDIDSFREWATSDDFPERGKIWWLRGEVWTDMSPEQVLTHAHVKLKFSTLLDTLATRKNLGMVFPDGVLLSNIEADISGEPDLTFATYDSIDSGRVVLVPGKSGGIMQLLGSPEMVLEVISNSSVRKDKDRLLEAYFDAGIDEYWLVDVRKEDWMFEIFRRGKGEFVATKKVRGWVHSSVFGKSFRLVAGRPLGVNTTFQLKTR